MAIQNCVEVSASETKLIDSISVRPNPSTSNILRLGSNVRSSSSRLLVTPKSPTTHVLDAKQQQQQQQTQNDAGGEVVGVDVASNVIAEFKCFGNRIVDVLTTLPAIKVAFLMTSLATFRHETLHQFCSRGGLYHGENTTNAMYPVNQDLDHLRLRDGGYQLIPEEHSEAFASIIDIVPPYIGIATFLPMFIAGVFRKFDKNTRDRMCFDLIADAALLIAIMISTRCIFFLSTALPGPDRECVRGERDWGKARTIEGLHHNPSCGDLIFSGHFQMSYSFFMWYFMESHRFFRGHGTAAQIFRIVWGVLLAVAICWQVYGILATRHHYTIDITVVPFVDYFVRWCILPKLNCGYDRLANQEGILRNDFVGLRLFGNSYEHLQADPSHNGPSKRAKIVGRVLFHVMIIGCAIAVFGIWQTMIDKVERKCVGVDFTTDAYCNFVNSYIRAIA